MFQRLYGRELLTAPLFACLGGGRLMQPDLFLTRSLLAFIFEGFFRFYIGFHARFPDSCDLREDEGLHVTSF